MNFDEIALYIEQLLCKVDLKVSVTERGKQETKPRYGINPNRSYTFLYSYILSTIECQLMTTDQLLKRAIKKGDRAAFKRLSSCADEETLTMTDKNGNNLAHLAVMYNQQEILQEIIEIADESGLSILKHTNNNGFTPLECCYLYSAPELIPLLQIKSQLSSSSTVVISQQYERLSKLPPGGFRREGLGKILFFASALNDVKALHLLLTVTDDQEKLLHHQTEEGWSGLHFAAYNNQIDVIKFFLSQDTLSKDRGKAKDNKGTTYPLHITG